MTPKRGSEKAYGMLRIIKKLSAAPTLSDCGEFSS